MTARYDVVVVGAGIHGAGVAQAAAAAGHDVLVLEQTAVAAGTSSRSSKLIHGGLRYLETGRVRLVRESLRERAHLLRLAPQLVRRVAFHVPIYRHSRHGPLTLRAGLSLYAVLGGMRAANRFAAVPESEWDTLDGLATDGLRAVFRYYDAQTDDAELTRAVMRSAQALGATLLCPARFVRATYHPHGIEIEYERDGRNERCVACALVNAAGAWVNSVLRAVQPATAALPIALVQGAHIVVPGKMTRGAYYVEAHDGRPVFVLPHSDATLVGTTETAHPGEPGLVSARPDEMSYLQQTLARHFPQREFVVTTSYAGLRVLPSGTGSYAARARDTVLHVDPSTPGVLSIYGGKLTTYRATAQRVMRHIDARLPRRTARAKTAETALT